MLVFINSSFIHEIYLISVLPNMWLGIKYLYQVEIEAFEMFWVNARKAKKRKSIRKLWNTAIHLCSCIQTFSFQENNLQFVRVRECLLKCRSYVINHIILLMLYITLKRNYSAWYNIIPLLMKNAGWLNLVAIRKHVRITFFSRMIN